MPAAGPEVEDALALVQLGDRGRVAAAEPGEDRGVGQLRLLERRVEAGADRLRLAGATTAGLRLERGLAYRARTSSWMVSVGHRQSSSDSRLGGRGAGRGRALGRSTGSSPRGRRRRGARGGRCSMSLLAFALDRARRARVIEYMVRACLRLGRYRELSIRDLASDIEMCQ